MRNVGDASASNVVVRFFVDGQYLAEGAIETIVVDTSGTATATWNTKDLRGDHTIRVVIDPFGAIREGRKNNNEASRSVTVQGNRLP